MSISVTVPPRKIVFLIFSDTHILDLAGPAQVFYEANQLGQPGLEILYASLRPEQNTRQGIRLSDLRHTNELKLGARDLLIIPGVDFHSSQSGELESEIATLTDWVQRQHKSGICLASICT